MSRVIRYPKLGEFSTRYQIQEIFEPNPTLPFSSTRNIPGVYNIGGILNWGCVILKVYRNEIGIYVSNLHKIKRE